MAAKASGLSLFTERLVLRDFAPADWQAWHSFAQTRAFWRSLLPEENPPPIETELTRLGSGGATASPAAASPTRRSPRG